MKNVYKSKFNIFLYVSLPVFLCFCVSGCSSSENKTSSQNDENQQKAEVSSLPVHFQKGNSASKIPFRIIDHQIVISARMNDSIMVDLFLDTGFGNKGVMLFDPELGEKMNLNYISQIPLGGGGNEEIKKANLATGISISLPGVVFNDLQALVVTDKKPFKDLPVDGVIGETLFDCVVEIDYDNNCLNLFDQNVQLYNDLGEEFILSFTYGIPVVKGEVSINKENIPVNLIVDTGAGLPFFLFTYSNDKIIPPVKNISARNEGLNGVMDYKLGRVSHFKVGKFLFNKTLTAFLDEKAMGSATALGQNGFFGHQTLQKFNVVFDYSRKRMFLKPNKNYSKEYEFNMAGLVLNTRPDGKLLIFDVVKDSPAWQEQIEPGDIITAINDKEVKKYNFNEIYDLFVQEGEKIKLTLERKSKIFDCTLFLKRII